MKSKKKYILKSKYKKMLNDLLFYFQMIISMIYFFVISILLYGLYKDFILFIHIILYFIFVFVNVYLYTKEN